MGREYYVFKEKSVLSWDQVEVTLRLNTTVIDTYFIEFNDHVGH